MNESLNVLLKQAEDERNSALAALREGERRAQMAATQAEQLNAYRDQYRQRWSTQFASSGGIEIMQCYQGFHDRLDHAIAQQALTVRQAEMQLQRLRGQLQQQELRVASVRKLIERRLAERSRLEARRDQKATDEAAARAGVGSPLASRLQFG
jgi:flagellar FliJ protein